MGVVAGRGRPLDVSKPLAHAYVIAVMSEFQGFVRDLHDLAVERIIAASGAHPSLAAVLTDGMVSDRGVDRGNATLRTIKADFGRLGLSPLDFTSHNPGWATDKRALEALIRLRNALGHGNESDLRALLAPGEIRDSVTWTRDRLPVLNRLVRDLDALVWDHLKDLTGEEPWT